MTPRRPTLQFLATCPFEAASRPPISSLQEIPHRFVIIPHVERALTAKPAFCTQAGRRDKPGNRTGRRELLTTLRAALPGRPFPSFAVRSVRTGDVTFDLRGMRDGAGDAWRWSLLLSTLSHAARPGGPRRRPPSTHQPSLPGLRPVGEGVRDRSHGLVTTGGAADDIVRTAAPRGPDQSSIAW